MRKFVVGLVIVGMTLMLAVTTAGASTNVSSEQAKINANVPGLHWRSVTDDGAHAMYGTCAINEEGMAWKALAAPKGISLWYLHIDNATSDQLLMGGITMIALADYYIGKSAGTWTNNVFTSGAPGKHTKNFGNGWSEELNVVNSNSGTVELYLIRS
ncbi:MAG: hypothetical protein WCF24_06110 [Acidimicrobiales bacterium]